MLQYHICHLLWWGSLFIPHCSLLLYKPKDQRGKKKSILSATDQKLRRVQTSDNKPVRTVTVRVKLELSINISGVQGRLFPTESQQT